MARKKPKSLKTGKHPSFQDTPRFPLRCDYLDLLRFRFLNFSEQNAKAALQVADYGYVMERGLIRLEGTPGELTSEKRIEAAFLGGQTA